ncbi:MAG: hypothetical protein ACI9LM_004243 [Alteromonadaceae bacterium]
MAGFNFTHLDKRLDKLLTNELSDGDDLDDSMSQQEQMLKRFEFINNHIVVLIKLSNQKVDNKKLLSKFSFETVSFFLYQYLEEKNYGRPYVYETDISLAKDICEFSGYKDINEKSISVRINTTLTEL